MKKEKDKNKIYSITLILIFLVAIFIRIYKFGTIPMGINQDGAMAALDAKALLEYGTDRLGVHLPVHLTAWGYGQMSALLSYLIISMIVFGLSMYCYGISIYIVPILLFLYAIYLKKLKIVGIKEIFIAVISYLLIAWPFILTMTINYFKIDSINFLGFTIPYFKDSIRSNDILFFSKHIFVDLINNLVFLVVIILQYNGDIWSSIPEYGTMYLFSLPIIIIGIINLIKNKNIYKSNGNMILIYFIVSILSGFITKNVNINRINTIYYLLIIFNGLGIYWFINNFNFSKYIIIPLYIISFIFLSFTYFNSYSNKISDVFYTDFTKALINTKNTNAKKIYITYNLNINNKKSVSEIITLFYHDIDAKYYQGKTVDELGLHYNERYNYTNYNNVDTNMKDTIYIVYEDELKYFKEPNIKTHFGKYYVIENE